MDPNAELWQHIMVHRKSDQQQLGSLMITPDGKISSVSRYTSAPSHGSSSSECAQIDNQSEAVNWIMANPHIPDLTLTESDRKVFRGVHVRVKETLPNGTMLVQEINDSGRYCIVTPADKHFHGDLQHDECQKPWRVRGWNAALPVPLHGQKRYVSFDSAWARLRVIAQEIDGFYANKVAITV